MDPTTLSPLASPAATPPAAPAPSRAISSDFDTFLRMLTVQMRNQDPLDPIDSADYAVQLATFSGVEQQVRTNELLSALQSQLALGGLSEMAAWVGREARAAMPARWDGAPVTLSPSPAATADAAELVVRDAQGREVSRSAIPVAAGPIEWVGTAADGSPLPPGLYRFEVVSRSQGEVLATSPCEVYATVTEVRAEGGKTVLVMDGGVTVEADTVTALRANG